MNAEPQNALQAAIVKASNGVPAPALAARLTDIFNQNVGKWFTVAQLSAKTGQRSKRVGTRLWDWHSKGRVKRRPGDRANTYEYSIPALLSVVKKETKRAAQPKEQPAREQSSLAPLIAAMTAFEQHSNAQRAAFRELIK